MKNFEKVPERSYSTPARKEIIDLDAPDPPPAIKKSSVSLSELQTKAIKKSSLSFYESELVLNSKPKDQEKLNKFIKVEKNEKFTRIKKSEDSRLTTLVKMRAKFCNAKGNQVEKKVKQGSLDKDEGLWVFNEQVQRIVGVKNAETLENLEFALRFFLRNNSKVLVNSYEFGDKEELCQVFGASHIKYLDLKRFIMDNSRKVS